jgi:hypothetical protein
LFNGPHALEARRRTIAEISRAAPQLTPNVSAAAGEIVERALSQATLPQASVSVPGLPGCWSQGTTEEEALQNVQDAIADYLAVVDELLGDADVREVDVAI